MGLRVGVGWGTALMLALAVSVDNFAVGFSCGLRKLVLPFASLLVICSLSAGAIALSMLAGSGVACLVPYRWISTSGGVILIILGLVVIRQQCGGGGSGGKESPMLPQEPTGAARRPGPKTLGTLLQRPEEADLDHSGILSAREALLLGSALAADAFASGFGAALIGAPFLSTVCAVGLINLLLLPLGAALGRAAVRREAPGYIPLLGGAFLIFIGIMNLF